MNRLAVGSLPRSKRSRSPATAGRHDVEQAVTPLRVPQRSAATLGRRRAAWARARQQYPG